MNEQVPVPFDLAAVLTVKVDPMGVEGECAEAKEQRRRGGECEGVFRLVRRRCEKSA